MSSNDKQGYIFDEFLFDADILALYHRGVLVKSAEKKPLEVLAVLLRRPGQLVSYDEIIGSVWAKNEYGVTPPRVNQYVSKLQKIFSELAPGTNYFENSKGRGYIFTGEVHGLPDVVKETTPLDSPMIVTGDNSDVEGSGFRNVIPFYVAGLTLLVVAIGAWVLYPRNEEEAIKKVVIDSQMYESLVLNMEPSSYSELELDKYWTPELQTNINYDRTRIREAAKKMVNEGRRYGSESKCEKFDFQSIDINKEGDTAIVKTLEKWFVAVYQNDGTPLKNRTIGPYFVTYIVKRIDDRWLIEKSSTARVNRPMPRLHSVEAVSELIAGKQFLIRLTGVDFEAETILVEVVGPGCPDIKPCKIPNAVLRDEAKLTDSVIENVPVTLSSGEYKIAVRNGDSQVSENITLKVP